MKSFLVLGMGRFGSALAEALYSGGNDVLVMDKNSEKINDMADHVTQAITGDICDENTLKSIGARNFDVVILAAASNMEVSTMATIILKELGVKYLVAKAQNAIHAKVLKKIGADKVLMPERDMGIRLAQTLVMGDFLDYIRLSSDYSIIELNVPESWCGKTIIEINIRVKYGVNILAIKNADGINPDPGANYRFKTDDVIVAIGPNKKISKLK